MTAGLHRTIRDDILSRWTAAWSSDVPVLWRSNDPQPNLDPSSVPHFLRNEVDFGREVVLAFGAGRGTNSRSQFGSVIFRCFTSRTLGDEDDGLDLLSSAMAVFRSYRATDGSGNDLSFIGDGTGIDTGPEEDGVWAIRGGLIVFEYRFSG